MDKQSLAVTTYLCAALLATATFISGCGGGAYSNAPAGPGGLGDTPPPVRSTNHWSTSFEAGEGYTTGDISEQNGWYIGWNPVPENGSATISGDMAATGSQSLKMEYVRSTDGTWWMNLFTLCAPSDVVPDIPLTSVTFRMKVYRTPGETEYPEGSGEMHSNLWFNQFLYNPSSVRYIDFGDADQDMLIHASLQNSTPRTFDDPGWEQVTGRFVEIVIYDNYVVGTRIVWYDGHKVATVPIYNEAKSYTSFELAYQAVNPSVPAELGKPMYIDDIHVNWEPAVPE